jgi:hypothetical protein
MHMLNRNIVFMQITIVFFCFILFIPRSLDSSVCDLNLDFQIIDSLPRPNSGGPVVIGDSDHDSLMEIIYEIHQPGLYPLIIYEYNPGTQRFDSVWTIGDSLPIFDIGDIDGDNKTEVLTQYKDSIRVYESVDSASYPSVLTWSQALPMNIHYHGQIVDLDQDGNKEILVRENFTTTYRIKIYECVGDNQFDSVFASPIYNYNGRDRAVGDFDQDGNMEFTAMDGSTIQVFENQGDNIYSVTWTYDWQQLNCQSTYGDDVDDDGFPEIIYGGNTGNDDYFAIFEKIADDSFAISWDTIISGLGSGVLAKPATGNVSYGAEQELVLTAYDQWHVWRNVGDNQYEWIYSYAFGVGHGLWGNTSVANVDGDPGDEIITGSQYTGWLYVFKDMNFGVEDEMVLPIKNNNFGATIFTGPLLLPEGKECRVFDITGRTVDLNRIKPGIYFIEVDGQITKKVIKVR